MSNNDNSYQKRLESLFSGIEPPEPTPPPPEPPRPEPPTPPAPDTGASSQAEAQAAMAQAEQQAAKDREQGEAEQARLRAAIAQAEELAAKEREQREAEQARLQATIAQAEQQAAKDREQREAEEARFQAAIVRAQQQAAQERKQREAEIARFEASVDRVRQQAAQEIGQREDELTKLEAELAQARQQAEQERQEREAAMAAMEKLRAAQATAGAPDTEKSTPAHALPKPEAASQASPAAKPAQHIPEKDSARHTAKFTISQWRENLLKTLLNGASALGALTLIISLVRVINDGDLFLGLIYIVVYAVLLTATFIRMPYRLRASIFLLIMYGLGGTLLVQYGLSGNGRLFLFAFTATTLLLLSLRASLGALIMSLLTMGAIGWMMSNNLLTTPRAEVVASTDSIIWATGSVVFLLLAVVVMRGLSMLKTEFVSTRYREQSMVEELQREREQLEQRVLERTKLIERRTTQIVTGAEVARAASAELNPDELLRRTVNLIRERFELYYVGAFLVDETGRYAELRAGTGEAGQTMLANHHRLEVGGNSMIGRAASEGQPRLALDVGFEGIRFNNPLLPNTRSEMALPLIAREHVLGAISIQSDQPEAFSPEDIVSLQGMTDLVAIALDNAHLFQEAQGALAEVTTLHQRYLSQAWERFSQSQHDQAGRLPTFAYANNTLIQGGAVELPAIESAVETQKAVVTHSHDGSTVTVPLKLRDQIIGAIALEAEEADHVWDPDELALIEAAAEQAALALENARLIEEAETALAEARRLANREQTVNVISDKLRRLPDVNSILSTTLVELGKTLGAGKGLVRLSGPGNNQEIPARKVSND
ncbi:MAG: GAF domain-containing protein [Chloroflexi bacterium]|nr:GAF domain-containing protein [Chloroflexota bacterium]